MRSKKISAGLILAAVVTFCMFGAVIRAHAQQEAVLHNFGDYGTNDGFNLYGNVARDSSGNLYGTTFGGGDSSCNLESDGCGVLFELVRLSGGGWSEKVLHNFGSTPTDGLEPRGGVTVDTSGNVYGTTRFGGSDNEGMVFEFIPMAGGGWSEKILHNFVLNGQDGVLPYSTLTLDSAGNLYGTTYEGGSRGEGTAFELTPTAGGVWVEKNYIPSLPKRATARFLSAHWFSTVRAIFTAQQISVAPALIAPLEAVE